MNLKDAFAQATPGPLTTTPVVHGVTRFNAALRDHVTVLKGYATNRRSKCRTSRINWKHSGSSQRS
jgi:hypothetical protein